MANRKRKKRLGALGDPAHVSRVIVGGTKPDGSKVTRAEVEKIVDVATFATGGAATVTRGQGRWRSPDSGKLYKEKATTIEVVSSANDSCDVFHRRMKAVAGRAARIADQESVITVTDCNGGRVEADLVTRRGARQARINPIRQKQLEGLKRRHRKRSKR